METIISRLEKSINGKNPTWTFPDTGRTYSLAEIRGLANTYALEFVNLGLSAQDRVALIINNSVELVAVLLACWRLNLVAVPLKTKPGKYHNYVEFLNGCHRSCDFKLVLCDEGIDQDDMQLWRQEIGITVQGIREFSLANEDGELPSITPQPQDMAIVQFSSGSTGLPKGVVVTHEMLINQLQHIDYSHSKNRQGKTAEICASWTPIHHDLGLFTGVLYPIYCGSRHILVTPDYFMHNPSRWFRMLSDKRVDLTFFTNSALAVSLRTIKRLYGDESVDLSNLHFYIAAEKISPVVLRKVYDRFNPLKLLAENVHSAYGMAENSLGASRSEQGVIKIIHVVISPEGVVRLANEDDQDIIELVSCGRANTRHVLTVRDEQDQILPEMRLGEINIESDCLTPGYLNMPEATAAKLKDNRLRTGDLGFFHQDELYFYTRMDDLIILGGRNIVPDDVEETVENIEFVRPSGSALLSLENNHSGLVELHLVVEGDTNDDAIKIAEKQKILTLAVLETHEALITKVHLCARGSVEKTSSGKKRRKVIKQRLIESQLELLTAAL